MKAVIYEQYGPPDVLHLTELAKPVPNARQVLIRVYATTVTKYDCWMRSCTAPAGFGLLTRLGSGMRKPRQPILGTEFAGEIAAVGEDVTRFRPGDAVLGYTGTRLGAYVEYLCLPEDGVLAGKPSKLTYEEAAAFQQGALTALFFLRAGGIARGQKVLIVGASGGVGMYAVQLAKYFGAEVTGVCSTAKVEFVRSLGADTVIDYALEDFTARGDTYDMIFDTVGMSSISRSRRVLEERGSYLFATFSLSKLVQIGWLAMTSRQRIRIGILAEKTDDLVFLSKVLAAGEIDVAIDRCFSFEQVVEAHRYVESGRKQGHVVLSVTEGDKSQPVGNV